MINWTKSMRQKIYAYTVNGTTWRNEELIDGITEFNISGDISHDTLYTVSITAFFNNILDRYIRIYLEATQEDYTERFPLGTFLITSIEESYSNGSHQMTATGYSPLMELSEKYPDIGYTIKKGANILDSAETISISNCRAKINSPGDETEMVDDYTIDSSKNCLELVKSMLSYANYELHVDQMGRILYAPIDNMYYVGSPVYVFNSGDDSILYDELSLSKDLYKIPNVVEVVYSSDSTYLVSTATNSDRNSPVSTISRGRIIKERYTNPSNIINPSKETLDLYASQYLENKSRLEYTVNVTHGYYPIILGDWIGVKNSKWFQDTMIGKVTSQNITWSINSNVKSEDTITIHEYLWRNTNGSR